MLGFLNFGKIFVFLIPALVIGWTLAIGGPVSEMPFGIQGPLEIFADKIASLIAIFPWLEIVFDIFIYGLQIKIILLSLEIIKFVIGIITAR